MIPVAMVDEYRERLYRRIEHGLKAADGRIIASELRQIDRIKESMAIGSRHTYASYRRAIDAIVAFLENKGAPATAEEIIEGVLEGGWNLTSPRSRYNVQDSIRYNLRRSSASPIQELNGMIGLSDWDEKLFVRSGLAAGANSRRVPHRMVTQ